VAEARERIADSAYCTVERSGSGQVILFAATPVFRDWFRARAACSSNAIVYGPERARTSRRSGDRGREHAGTLDSDGGARRSDARPRRRARSAARQESTR
jgi:hypothetical protein